MTAKPPARGHPLLWLVVLAGLAAAAVAYEVLPVAPPMPLAKADGLHGEDRIVLAAYEYQLSELVGRWGSTFCLARGGISLVAREYDGPSPAVVAALDALGYDVVSVADCVQSDVGGSAAVVSASRCLTVISYLAALVSGSECLAGILFVGSVEIDATGIATVEVSQLYGFSACEGQRLRFSLDGRIEGPGERTFIC